MNSNYADYDIVNVYSHERQPIKMYNSSIEEDRGTWQVKSCA